MLWAVGDALIRAGESGKRRGWVSRDEAQYLAATPQGWFDGPTLGAFLDARRRCNSWIWREIVLEAMSEMQKFFAVWRQHVVQLEADVATCVPGGLRA